MKRCEGSGCALPKIITSKRIFGKRVHWNNLQMESLLLKRKTVSYVLHPPPESLKGKFPKAVILSHQASGW